MISALTLGIIGFVLYVVLKSTVPWFARIAIFTYFLWVFINVQGSDKLATLYLFASLFTIAAAFALDASSIADAQSGIFGGFKVKGLSFDILAVFLGVGIFMVMKFIQQGQTASILGTPSLAVGAATQSFHLLNITVLAFVENDFFITLFRIFQRAINMGLINMFWVLSIFGPVIPFLLTPLLFAVFHLAAYGLAISNLVFAGIIFMIWILSFLLLGTTLAADVSHGLWNFTETLNRVAAIAI